MDVTAPTTTARPRRRFIVLAAVAALALLASAAWTAHEYRYRGAPNGGTAQEEHDRITSNVDAAAAILGGHARVHQRYADSCTAPGWHHDGVRFQYVLLVPAAEAPDAAALSAVNNLWAGNGLMTKYLAPTEHGGGPGVQTIHGQNDPTGVSLAMAAAHSPNFDEQGSLYLVAGYSRCSTGGDVADYPDWDVYRAPAGG
jgi:hypothetical protein